MSIVGPRPQCVNEIDKLGSAKEYYTKSKTWYYRIMARFKWERTLILTFFQKEEEFNFWKEAWGYY